MGSCHLLAQRCVLLAKGDDLVLRVGLGGGHPGMPHHAETDEHQSCTPSSGQQSQQELQKEASF